MLLPLKVVAHFDELESELELRRRRLNFEKDEKTRWKKTVGTFQVQVAGVLVLCFFGKAQSKIGALATRTAHGRPSEGGSPELISRQSSVTDT